MRNFRIFPRFTPLTIAYAAVLIALGVVLSIYSIPISITGIPVKKIGFGMVPVMLSGMLFGPIVGGLVGAATDILQSILNPALGPYNPVFTITSFLIGAIPSLFYLWDKASRKSSVWSFLKMLLAVSVTMLICSVFLNTIFILVYSFPQYAQEIVSGHPGEKAQLFLIARGAGAAVSTVLYTIVLHVLYRYRRVYISPRMEKFERKKQPA